MKTVLFDLDGTVLDTAPDFLVVLNQLLSLHGRKQVSHEDVRATVSNGARALVSMGFEIDADHQQFPSLLEQLLDLYIEQIPSTRSTLFPGMDQLIEQLDAQKIPWGIVTNKPVRFTTPLLANFHTLKKCQVVICPDHVSKSKPDPEGLILACHQLKANSTMSFYVGDHERDVEAGKNAHMKTVAVGWGYFSKDTDPNSWGADYLVENTHELSRVLLTD